MPNLHLSHREKKSGSGKCIGFKVFAVIVDSDINVSLYFFNVAPPCHFSPLFSTFAVNDGISCPVDMKPPPRFRVKPVTCVLKEKKENKWQLREQKELIAALKILKSRHESTTEDIDYGFIAERLPNRSESEVRGKMSFQI